MAEDVKCTLNDAQVKGNLKEALSKGQWLAMNELMDQDSMSWDDLSLIEAYELGEKSMKNRLRKKVNRKEFRSFERKNKASVGSAGGSAGSAGSPAGGSVGGKGDNKTPDADAKGATAAASKKTVPEKIADIPCRFLMLVHVSGVLTACSFMMRSRRRLKSA